MKASALSWPSIVALMLLAAPAGAGVIFTEDFEESTVGEMTARWSDVRSSSALSFSTDVPPGSGGSRSLMMRHIVGVNSGAHLYRNFPEGYDTLYARFDVKFSAGHNPVKHFVKLGGYNPPSPWPLGNAGELPDGTDNFITGVEPGESAWGWQFYTYWMHMRGDTASGYWGNVFHPDPPVPAPRGEWAEVEMMLVCNQPVAAWNGEQAFRIDGDEAIDLGEGHPKGYWLGGHFFPDEGSPPFEGFQWRAVDDLRLTFFWLNYYVTAGAGGEEDTVWFDDVVVSTEPIGVTVGTGAAAETGPPLELITVANPFRPGGEIAFLLPEPAPASLSLFDLNGRLVRTVEPLRRMGAGRHRATWDGLDRRGRRAASGVYFVRLDNGAGAGAGATTAKIVLIR